MFGYPCALVGGNLLTGLHQESSTVCLAESDHLAAIGEQEASLFEAMSGRPMREYIVLPEAAPSTVGSSSPHARKPIACDTNLALIGMPQEEV
jgi:hypothetical protein